MRLLCYISADQGEAELENEIDKVDGDMETVHNFLISEKAGECQILQPVVMLVCNKNTCYIN